MSCPCEGIGSSCAKLAIFADTMAVNTFASIAWRPRDITFQSIFSQTSQMMRAGVLQYLIARNLGIQHQHFRFYDSGRPGRSDWMRCTSGIWAWLGTCG